MRRLHELGIVSDSLNMRLIPIIAVVDIVGCGVYNCLVGNSMREVRRLGVVHSSHRFFVIDLGVDLLMTMTGLFRILKKKFMVRGDRAVTLMVISVHLELFNLLCFLCCFLMLWLLILFFNW